MTRVLRWGLTSALIFWVHLDLGSWPLTIVLACWFVGAEVMTAVLQTVNDVLETIRLDLEESVDRARKVREFLEERARR